VNAVFPAGAEAVEMRGSPRVDGWIERHRGYVMIVLLCLVVLGVVAFLMRSSPSPQRAVLDIATAPPTLTPVPSSTPGPLRVYVSGAVARPDVYQLAPGCIVKDALKAAGGALPSADLVRINLALQLFDQQQVHVPLAGETPPPVGEPAEARSSSPETDCVDINHATLEELDGLPGIGPVYAQCIVEYRAEHGSFEDVGELIEISGIGPATLEKIRDLACVR
jgi:competence protein ComEA